MSHHPIASREDWLVARKDLLRKEKELTRRHDDVSAERRALPWVKVAKEYTFAAPEGQVTLADLFRPCRRRDCPSRESRRELCQGLARAAA
jgi:predicted dithiol-disulfide oxidoreductase (DUF899 family)